MQKTDWEAPLKADLKDITLKNNRRVILCSPSFADAENLLRHFRIAHTEAYKNLNQSPKYWNAVSVLDEQKTLADFEKSKSKFMLAAFSDGRIVGGLGFVGAMAEFKKKNATIGMSIQREFCNTGLGTEMMKYALVLGKEFGFHRVELTVRTYNDAGIALYENIGFKRIGLLKDAAFVDGRHVDEYSYQIIMN